MNLEVSHLFACFLCTLLQGSDGRPKGDNHRNALRQNRNTVHSWQGLRLTNFKIGPESQSFIFDWDEPPAFRISRLKRKFGVHHKPKSCGSTEVDDGVNARSTCPWYYVKDVNPDRFPKTIYQAVSQNTDERCVGKNNEVECLPINITFTGIFRRNGTLRAEDINATIGFTGVRRRTAENAASFRVLQPQPVSSEDRDPVVYA